MPCSGFNAGSIEFDAVESDFCELVRADATGSYDTEIRDSCEVKCSESMTSPVTMEVVEEGEMKGECGRTGSRMCAAEVDLSVRMEEEEEAGVEEEEEEEEEENELFFQPPRRISMLWNSKLKWKEERKKVLKISIGKLRKIEDPELSLCRAILINNTVKRLHREIRDEKMARYPDIIRPIPMVTAYHLTACHNPSIPEAFPKKRPAPTAYDYCAASDVTYDKENLNDYAAAAEASLAASGEPQPSPVKRARVTNAKNELFPNDTSSSSSTSSSLPIMDDYRNELRTGTSPLTCQQQYHAFHSSSFAATAGGTQLLDLNEAKGAGLRSEPSPPPTSPSPPPRNHLVSLECCTKDEMNTFNRYTGVTTPANSSSSSSASSTAASTVTSSSSPAASPKDKMAAEYEKQYSQYSCGQFSIFGELQSVVFHSLITSLES